MTEKKNQDLGSENPVTKASHVFSHVLHCWGSAGPTINDNPSSPTLYCPAKIMSQGMFGLLNSHQLPFLTTSRKGQIQIPLKEYLAITTKQCSR